MNTLSKAAEHYESAAEVLEKDTSIRGGSEVAAHLNERAGSIRRGLALTLQHTGKNADGHAKIEALPEDTAGECHMSTGAVRIDLEKSGEDADHVILHEYFHREHSRNNDGERILSTELEEGITDGAAQAVTGKNFTYQAEKGLARRVAIANGVREKELHKAYAEGDSEQINAWFLNYEAKAA